MIEDRYCMQGVSKKMSAPGCQFLLKGILRELLIKLMSK